MKKIIIAPDSFKESLSATEVTNAIEVGLLKADSRIQTIKLPLADGGEGTLEAILSFSAGCKVSSLVCNAAGQPIECYFLLLEEQQKAVIEIAQSIGLAQLTPQDRNPLHTSSFGVGQQILQALDAKVDEIIITLGGSATNDCGAGLLQALGAQYYGSKGELIHATGGNLNLIDAVELSQLDPRLAKTRISLLCDVTNPLHGNNGASCVFAPQKGATAEDAIRLDDNLKHFSKLLEKECGKTVADIQGAGAAGGIAAALLAVTDAQIDSGIDYLLSLADFFAHLQDADLVITGEGRIDHQTLNGKVVSGVAKHAKQANVPVIALAGSVESSIDSLYDSGITAVFSICAKPMPLAEAFLCTEENLIRTSENILRMLNLKKSVEH